MNTKFRLLTIALVVAIFSVQCTPDIYRAELQSRQQYIRGYNAAISGVFHLRLGCGQERPCGCVTRTICQWVGQQIAVATRCNDSHLAPPQQQQG